MRLIRLSSEPLIALVTWSVVSGAVVYFLVENPSLSVAGTLEISLFLLLTNLACMLSAAYFDSTSFRARVLNALQLLSVLALAWFIPFDFLQIFTIIWIAMAVSFYSFRTCLAALPVICLTWYLISRFHWYDSNPAISVLLFGTFHLFALYISRVAQLAERSRDIAQATTRELLATQSLLSEVSRQQERTRIARDLHDLLGHHLTALSINLQIAERLSDGEAQDKIAHSRALARLLLSDVREAVSVLRDEELLDVQKALQSIVTNVPSLQIDCDVDASVHIEKVDVAEAVVRCVQEAITNSARHSGAQRCQVRLWQDVAGLHVTVEDNGQATPRVREGAGLTGMRERLAAVGGELTLSQAKGGVLLHATLPTGNT